MRILKYTIMLFLASLNTVVQAQPSDPFHAVQKLFSAMSAYNYDAMYETATDDFQLLEQGEVWDMAKLIDEISAAEGEIARRNYFSVIRTVDNKGSFWISYWNQADFESAEGEKGSVAWLESVVVVEQDGEWKLQMMHSTGIKGVENLPEGLEMEEYIGEGAFKIAD